MIPLPKLCLTQLSDQELGDAAGLLAEGSLTGDKDRRRKLRWRERLSVTQSSLTTQVRAELS